MSLISLLFHDLYRSDPRESGFASAAADRYKLRLDDFTQHVEALKRVRSTAPALLEGPNAPASSFLITVDDGGVSYYTLMADILEASGWRGHCFVSTGMIGCRGFLSVPEIRELDARGHIIGSHSVTHPARFSACSPQQMRQEWTDSRHTLEDILGHEVVAASVPGGYYSRHVAASARASGLRVLFNSEPTTATRDVGGLLIAGRFTIRHGDPHHLAAALVAPAPWARCAAWVSWNAKGIVKPILGPSYRRVADWVLAGSGRARATWS